MRRISGGMFGGSTVGTEWIVLVSFADCRRRYFLWSPEMEMEKEMAVEVWMELRMRVGVAALLSKAVEIGPFLDLRRLRM